MRFARGSCHFQASRPDNQPPPLPRCPFNRFFLFLSLFLSIVPDALPPRRDRETLASRFFAAGCARNRQFPARAHRCFNYPSRLNLPVPNDTGVRSNLSLVRSRVEPFVLFLRSFLWLKEVREQVRRAGSGYEWLMEGRKIDQRYSCYNSA